MNDPLHREILENLMVLNSEQKVNEVVDMINSIHFTNSAEIIISLLRTASRIIHPSASLFLLKFVSAYAKKDQKFLKSCVDDLPSIVLFCYQSCDSNEKATLRMYVSGWKMRVAPWPEVAHQTEGALGIQDNKASLSSFVEMISPSPVLLHSLSLLVKEGDKMQTEPLQTLVTEASGRLALVIRSINHIRLMVGT